MHTTRSAMSAAAECRSASDTTTTLSTRSSAHARTTRSAISPRLATRTRFRLSISGVGFEEHQQRAVFDHCAVLRLDNQYVACLPSLDLVHEFHDLDDADRVVCFHSLADLNEGRAAWLGRAPEESDGRARDL